MTDDAQGNQVEPTSAKPGRPRFGLWIEVGAHGRVCFKWRTILAAGTMVAAMLGFGVSYGPFHEASPPPPAVIHNAAT